MDSQDLLALVIWGCLIYGGWCLHKFIKAGLVLLLATSLAVVAFADGPYQEPKKPKAKPIAAPKPVPTPAPTPAPYDGAEDFTAPAEAFEQTPVATPPPAVEPEPTPKPTAAPVSLTIVAGGLVSLGGGADSALRPLVSGLVDLPVSDAVMGPRLVVAFDLAALPGESLDLLRPQTYRSISVSGGLTQPLSSRLKFSIYAMAGFASRLPGDSEPRNRSARWASFGIRFIGARGLLEVGGGPDERLGGAGYYPTGHVRAALMLGEVARVKTYLIGNALLALRLGYSPEERTDLVLVGIGVGGGR